MTKKMQPETREIKERIPAWLYPSTLEKMDKTIEYANCKSRSEFIENAIGFYSGYIMATDSSRFLTPTLASVIRGTMDDSENRIARLLFKLAVETSMMMHVLASGLEIDDDTLHKLRGRCVNEVKKTSGRITFDKAVEIQRDR